MAIEHIQTGEVAGVSAEGLEETVFPGWERKEGRVQFESVKIKTKQRPAKIPFRTFDPVHVHREDNF